MSNKKVLFVFRKPNRGNYSIERVYHSIFDQLKNKKDTGFDYRKMTLKHNYDLFCFLNCFLDSLFAKKYVVHITGGCNYMVMAFPFKKRILTIHDLYHYRRFKGIKGAIYNLFYYKFPISFSHKIVAVSENTKNELLQNFKNIEKKVVVIENPLVIPKEKISKRERNLSENQTMHILQIGDKPLKNYERLIEATKDLNGFYHFVHSQTKTIHLLIKQHGIENRSEIYSDLNDGQLYQLYNKADVLFFASEAEGFGLPLIEAQVFGVPVVTSNIEPFKSIGRGALFVNPYSVTEIKKAFSKLYDSEFVKNKISEDKENSKRFALKEITTKYDQLYAQL
tara:strand:+ start:13841 stop:14851 length:1011 start_codon:yes stop_codon:yes gene_type:complete